MTPLQLSQTEPALAFDAVARRFGRRWVLRGVDLRIMAGAVTGLLGRNGGGKTTLLRVAATALRPTRGAVRVYGVDAFRQPAAVRPWIGLLGHHAGVYDELTAAENLRFSLRMAGLPADRARIRQVLERVRLTAEHDEVVRGFSAGMRRRLGLARLMLRPPRLLLLDEPYASFDADGIETINGFAREITTAGGAVLMTTHDLERGAGVIDRVVRIEEGRIIEAAPMIQTAIDPGCGGASRAAAGPLVSPLEAVG
jgi:heme exporter protein A